MIVVVAVGGGRVRAGREATAMGEKKRKIRWWTVVLAALWVILPIAIASFVPIIRGMWEEMYAVVPVLTTRIVLGVPAVAHVTSGLLIAGVLVWKSKALSGAASSVVDAAALVLLLVLVGIAAHALSALWWYIPVSYTGL